MAEAVVEKTVSWVTTVPDMTSAFAFVMGHVDEFRSPSIMINPLWTQEVGADDWTLGFEVKISGEVTD